MNRPRFDSKPWYRQPWLWFVIALPTVVVVAALYTVYIAFSNPPSMVDDNYYKEGLAINQSLAQDQRARELGLNAELLFDADSATVMVTLSGDADPQALQLKLTHPASEQGDISVVLTHLATGQYSGQLEGQLSHRYYLRLLPIAPTAEQGWRLNGEIDFSCQQQVVLAAKFDSPSQQAETDIGPCSGK